MAFYLIHACKEREWYVNNFLIPSLKAQGIADTDIEVWMDADHLGNLESFIRSCEYLYSENPDGGTWHIQDDVIICRRFKELTEKYDSGIVNGFCEAHHSGDLTQLTGETPVYRTWYSFQCVRIPNVYGKECSEWYREYVIPTGHNINDYSEGRNDDGLWRDFLVNRHLGETCINLNPNLVDHVDFLIGGSLIWKNDMRQRRAFYFEDRDLVEQLEKDLRAYSEKSEKTKKARHGKKKLQFLQNI